MQFVPGLKPPSAHKITDLWFIFNKGKLVTRVMEGRHHLPGSADLAAAGLKPTSERCLGHLDGRVCYGAELPQDSRMPENYRQTDLRALFGRVHEDLIWIAGRANHLLHWQRIHRYCGQCGGPTRDKTDERALICPGCGLVNYPRLSPAVIVAVHRDDRILLGRNKRFRRPFYSVLAGFVEPGETLEACVEREIKEEVGISVKDIRYFGSQPWPFPDALMVGFTADYASGEIEVDNVELGHADWFSKYDLPQIPPSISIARQLIDAFVQRR